MHPLRHLLQAGTSYTDRLVRVYPHDWHEKDLVLFHNRGVLNSAVGAFSQNRSVEGSEGTD